MLPPPLSLLQRGLRHDRHLQPALTEGGLSESDQSGSMICPFTYRRYAKAAYMAYRRYVNQRSVER